MDYEIKEMLLALEKDGAPSFGKGLVTFCYMRLKSFVFSLQLHADMPFSNHNHMQGLKRRQRKPSNRKRTQLLMNFLRATSPTFRMTLNMRY